MNRQETFRLDLNGPWKIRWTDGNRGGRAEFANRDVIDPTRYFDAQVPGEVHLDLWRQGVIPDPYVGTNCLASRWVEECIWSYRREFEATPEMLAGKSWLVFEGLDLVATIVLNGVEIARHKNVFYPCRVDVTGKLRAGNNVLAVHLDSGLYDIADKPIAGWSNNLDLKLHKRHWLRKPQCQFGWDWSTRLINVGIYKPAYLEYTEPKATVRIDQLVPLAELSQDLQTGRVRTRLFVEGLTDKLVPGRVVVELGNELKASADVEIAPGLRAYEVTLEVPQPRLWWPVGHGDQALYTLRASLIVDDKNAGEKSAEIGFRHVKVNQEPHPEGGRYFVFEINGRKIFCRGGNFVPGDMIFARLDYERYDRLTDMALEANFNFLRVWGGGVYESDDFYALCNRKGIMVWQEFIFACSRYPTTDEAFFNDVKAEAVYNIRRLACHPSLVAWCGNNEMEQGAWEWGFDHGVVYPDYALYHLTLPRLLAQEDPTRYYQPSSPYSPDHLKPTRDDVGDQHPWSVGFSDTDFRKYREMICRFPNEGGILGPTALPTVLACLPEGQRQVHSFAWQLHENSIDIWEEPSYPDTMIKNWIGRDPCAMSIEEFTYRAGLVQGEGLREYIDNFRRRMFSSASAIFWMFNDCWPAVRSWTIADYYLRRTPAFYHVKRAMAPISVVLAMIDQHIVVYGVNDTPDAVKAELRYGVFQLAGELSSDNHVAVTLPANTSTELASFSALDLRDPSLAAGFAVLHRGDEIIARNKLILPYFKDLNWTPPNVNVQLQDGYAIFTSPMFVWGVCLDLDGETPLADNFFDIYPQIPYRIKYPGNQPPKILWMGNLDEKIRPKG